MPSTREIKRRIGSIKNISQITRAMQMVASSKMRRAQERVEQSRPYADQLRAMVSRLSRAAGVDVGAGATLMTQRPVRKIGYVLITPDRGLCGALPSNINRRAANSVLEVRRELEQQSGGNADIDFVAVGRKGRDFVVRSPYNLLAEFTNYGDRPGLNDASAISQVAMDAFVNGDVDVVYLVYAKYINTVTQTPTVIKLLPVEPPAEEGIDKKNVEYIYEPNPQSLFEALLPRYVDIQVYQALLESLASQWSAQMVAMKNATDSAKELLEDLNLTYNKARQASITTQILEIVSGAEALG
ncbi:MAG TPA: ATP synthase F1 subunit gamma [Ktedonobacteraceae bacterium]|nr:ATP synthase F1 subunit gamma [Ktedonobacteraceae bacterium]